MDIFSVFELFSRSFGFLDENFRKNEIYSCKIENLVLIYSSSCSGASLNRKKHIRVWRSW